MAKSKKTKKGTPSKTISKKTISQRGRKKQIRLWGRYATSLCIVLIFIAGWIGYEQRVDEQISHWANQQWLKGTASAGFTFQELIVEGRQLTKASHVVDAVGIDIGDPLFMASLTDIRKRLVALDTVKDASVSRDLNGRILITLEERKPFALWQHQGITHVIDDEGTILQQENAAYYSYLVTVVGEHAPKHLNELVSVIETDKELSEQVAAAVFVSNRRWDIHFSNGIHIMLPELQPNEAWQHLSTLHREHDILKQQLQAIDLRIDDRVFITLPDEIDNLKDASNV